MNILADIQRSTFVPTISADLRRIPHIQGSTFVPTTLPDLGRIPIPELVPNLKLRILNPDFNIDIAGPILEIDQRQEQREVGILLRVEIAEGVQASVVLSGADTGHGKLFEVRQLSFQLLPTEQRATPEFVASTLNAALKLSPRVQLQINEIGFDLALTEVDSPLLEVSWLLQERQTAYRLMNIELATGIDFGVLPYTLLGDEVHTISFVYHSIVDRSFIDGVRDAKVLIPATEEGLQGFHLWKDSPSLEFPPEIVTKSLLGKFIFLGTQTVKITDPYIEDVDRVQEELARRDGHEVTIVIRSHSNRALYSLPEAPRLPSNPWDSRMQSLIDLERKLDSRLIERYHSLAAGSLVGLTDREKKRVTMRPQLNRPSLLAILREKLGL